MTRIMIPVIAVTFAMFALGCGSGESANETAEESIPVAVQTIALGNLVQTLSYDGDIEAECEVRVFSKIPDRIEQLYVDEGDAVKRGQVIARIAATAIEQSVRQAEAGLAAAKAQEANLRMEFERTERLYREKAFSQQQYDAVKTQYEAIQAQAEQAEALLKSAKSQLNDATITAPIPGIIGNRYAEAGDMAAPTLPLVRIVQMDCVKIIFNVTETDLGKISAGQPAVVAVKSYPDAAFSGKVSKISPVLDPLTRLAKVEVLIENPQHRLKPGMFATVEVTTGSVDNVIVIPRHAAIENTTLENIDGKDRVIRNYYVYVADSNRVEQRQLTVSYVNHEYLAVTSGVMVGEKLITMGQNYLRNGSLVTIVKNSETPAAREESE